MKYQSLYKMIEIAESLGKPKFMPDPFGRERFNDTSKINICFAPCFDWVTIRQDCLYCYHNSARVPKSEFDQCAAIPEAERGFVSRFADYNITVGIDYYKDGKLLGNKELEEHVGKTKGADFLKADLGVKAHLTHFIASLDDSLDEPVPAKTLPAQVVLPYLTLLIASTAHASYFGPEQQFPELDGLELPYLRGKQICLPVTPKLTYIDLHGNEFSNLSDIKSLYSLKKLQHARISGRTLNTKSFRNKLAIRKLRKMGVSVF
jgi:hypothetical protein